LTILQFGVFNPLILLQLKLFTMSLQSSQNDKAGKGKKPLPSAQNSKFISKPGKTNNNFVKKVTNTGSRRGS
jgi:hypothetical protein